MPANINDVAPAMRKLTRESTPVKLLKSPFQLSEIRAEIERFQEAKDIKLESGFMAFFRRKSDADLPIEDQIKVLKAREEFLASDWIDGTLTPLSEAEKWEVRCEWGAIRKTLLEKELQYAEGSQARIAYHDEVEKASSGIWISKWVGIALKLKDRVEGKWVRCFPTGDLSAIEPVTLNYIFNIYHENFSLSDDELKKFVAPTKAAN